MKKNTFDPKSINPLNPLRSVKYRGTVYFALCDLAEILGYASTAALRKRAGSLSQDWVESFVVQTAGGRQLLTFVTVEALWFLILRSNKPAAELYRSWMLSMLPSCEDLISPANHIDLDAGVPDDRAMPALVENTTAEIVSLLSTIVSKLEHLK